MAKKAYMQNDSLIDPHEAARRTWDGGDKPVDLRSTRSERVQHIPVTQIVPDPRQPRRAVPSVVRQIVPDTRYGVTLLEAWSDQLGSRLSTLTKDILEGRWEAPDDYEPRPIEVSWLSLLDLAASIRRDGLTNPITVVQDGERYRLETGERRWLAYCLLDAFFEGEYATIPARVVDDFDVWRQASENNARSDLNAIGRARQFAILLMDLLGAEQFAPFEAFALEQDFYAQVSGGEVWRIPRGEAPRLVAAMGLKNTQQLRQYRGLLRLPPDVWVVADDESWAESVCRPFVPGDSVSIDTLSDDDPPPPPGLGGVESVFIPPRSASKSETDTPVQLELPLTPTLRGEVIQAKNYTMYIANSINRTNPQDREAVEEIKRRAQWMADYWRRVVERLEG